jgi:hypothetical protein
LLSNYVAMRSCLPHSFCLFLLHMQAIRASHAKLLSNYVAMRSCLPHIFCL